MDKLVSVIVPVYNVDRYLGRCIKSIMQQSYRNLEIILVDDGSTDNSGTICDTFKETDDRIIVIHKENGGLSDARNAGIKMFTGEYVTFIDSDDYVSPDMISLMLTVLKQSSCQIVQCEFVRGKDDTYKFTGNGKYKVYNKRNAFENRDVHVCVCGKLYEKSLIKGRYFPIGKINEDEYYTYKCVYESNRTAIMPDALYYYFQRSNSIMHKKKTYLNMDILDAFDERIKYFQDRKEERLVIISRKEKCIREALLYARAKGCIDEKEKREYLKKLFRVEYLKIKKENFSMRERAFLKVYYYFPSVVNILLERKIR